MRRFMAIIICLAMIIPCFSGCGKNNSPSPENPITLTMWHVYGSQTTSPLNTVIDEFNRTVGKENGITINVASVTSSSAIDKALAAAASGEPGAADLPDLFTAYPRVVEIIGEENLLTWNDYFTEKELSLILQTEVTTNDTVTSDKVFLLSSSELEWLKTADISIDATPTDKAFELDSSGWYKLYLEEYDTTDHYWWLRDADGVTSYGVMTVPNSLYHNIPQSEFASLEGYGVRPVMWVEITDEYFLQ